MARPKKIGLEYFPLDTVLDTKFELIEAEFGLQGFAIVVKLLQMIYREQGYYCEWNTEVALLFAKRNNVGGNVVSETISSCIKRGIFDKALYVKYHILTSRGIQARYVEAKRADASIIKNEYLLLSVQKNEVNATKTEVNATKTRVNVGNMQQSKEKKSKVNNNILLCFDKFWELYPKKKNRANALRAWENISPSSELVGVIMQSLKKQTLSDDWQRENGRYIPLAENWLKCKRWEDEPTRTNPTRTNKGYNNKFNDFSQRTYTEDEFKKIIEMKGGI